MRRIGARFLPALVDVHRSDADDDGDVVAPGRIPAILDEVVLVRAELTRLATETCTPDRTVERHTRYAESRLDGRAAHPARREPPGRLRGERTVRAAARRRPADPVRNRGTKSAPPVKTPATQAV